MRPLRRTPLLPAVAAVAALTLVSACGSSDEPESSSSSSSEAPASDGASPSESAGGDLTVDDFGDRVSAAFQEAGTVTFEIQQSGAGQEAKGTGQADLESDPIASKVDLDTPQGTVSVIIADGIFYLKIPQLPTDGKWLEVDPDDESGLGALIGQLGGSADPSTSIEVLKKASEVTATGEEEIDGVATTGYQVVLPREAVAESLEVAPEVVQLLTEELTYDVWVDGDDLVRRVVSTVEVQGQSSTTTVTYTGYGDPVDVAAPPADQVTDQAPAGLGG